MFVFFKHPYWTLLSNNDESIRRRIKNPYDKKFITLNHKQYNKCPPLVTGQEDGVETGGKKSSDEGRNENSSLGGDASQQGASA